MDTLHRMRVAVVMDTPSTTPNGFYLDDYIASGELNFAVGDTIDLKAWISKDMAIHLQERPLHSNQLISESDDERILLNVTVQDTNELRWWLLGFGDQVEVVAPEDLRSDFHAIANKMAKAYQRKQTG